MLYGTAQATGQTRYAFNPRDYVSTDNNRAPQDRFSYDDDHGYFRIAATGQNNVAFKMKESLNDEYYITGDERWFLIKGSNLSTADGATYLWWINGHNNGQVPPSYICSYGGSQYFIWNMECINSIFSWFRDNTGEKITLNGRDADWKLVTAAGLTALDGNGGTISDIGFYSDKEINDKYNVLAKYLSVSQYPYRVDVTADYITNPSFEADNRTLQNPDVPYPTGWTCSRNTTWWGINVGSGGGDPQATDGTYIFGVASTLISFIVLGNYGLGLQMHGKFDVLGFFTASGGDLYGTVIEVIKTLPLWRLVLVVLVLSMVAFYATSFDGITLVASQYSYRELREGQEASRKMKLFWAVLLIMLPIALIFSEGSMNNLQTVSIIAAFPIGLVIILIIASFIRDAGEYLKELEG